MKSPSSHTLVNNPDVVIVETRMITIMTNNLWIGTHQLGPVISSCHVFIILNITNQEWYFTYGYLLKTSQSFFMVKSS